jgi:CRP-like cAMP-binding protein
MVYPTRELLAKSPVFRSFSRQDQEDLCKLARYKSLVESEFLAMQGSNWPYLLLLKKGTIKTHKVSQGGRALGAFRLKTGDVFCSPSLIDDGPLPATLEGGENCEIYLWKKEEILPYILRNNQALWDLSILLVQRMRHASEMVEDLAFHPVAVRVAGLLLKHQIEGENHLDRDFTLDEMATMIGTTPVMVCKVLSQFADQELIKVSRTEIEFINQQALASMVNKE